MSVVNRTLETAIQKLGEDPASHPDVLLDDRDSASRTVELSGALAVQVAATLGTEPRSYEDHVPGHSLSEHGDEDGGRVRVFRTEPDHSTARVKVRLAPRNRAA